MNEFALAAGIIAFIGFVVHAVVGTREISRLGSEPRVGKDLELWTLAMCGWQIVSVDLLLTAIALLVVAFSELFPAEHVVLLLVAGYYAIASLTWALTVAIAGRDLPGKYARLGQWIFCLTVAELAFMASL